MAEDVVMVIDHKNQKVISIDQQPTVYNTKKTANAWMVTNEITGETTDYRVFENYNIIVDPITGYTTYILRGAYTHILRKILNFNPQQWQLQYLLGEKRENYLA